MAQTQDIRPFHTARTPQQRMVAITIVTGLHVAVIAAFVVALNPKVIPILPHCLCLDIIKTAQPQPLPTHIPEPTLKDATNVKIPEPVVTIDTDSGPGPFVDAHPTGGTSAVGATFLPAHGILSTHTTPNYPPLEARLAQEGSVHLKLSIDESGAVMDATVSQSSGYSGLDDAAVAWVKAHWRYTPATREGKPVATTSDAIVTFKLTGRS